ncbi:MAG: glycosyltransferase [Clostridiales Family XIII bacterium]|jgi:GT2 family glycosyltransferase/SAM-dependent methyltransferase|nr:glycosyltransferase [Clostridiales Family XIII bacterium]
MQLETENGKVVYSDGASAEELMLQIATDYPEKASADFIAQDSHYTLNNTFSPVRHNLLNWYPFKPDSDILEVGSGMGSVTGLLCDVARRVTAVEMNQNRAAVIKARFPDRKNLTILHEDITAWETEQRFDYVVVVGVLEYAGVFDRTSANPYVGFVESLRRLLKPGGIVLLAIENRFGLKYWLGASEDHLQEPFVGIEGYEKPHTPKTFSKAELEEIFEDAGLFARRFYYVLPDYKFPTAIFTDAYLPSAEAVRNVHFTYSKGSCLVADERKLYADVIQNDLFPNFANSYLIEAGVDSIPEDQVIMVAARGECPPEYRIVTEMLSTGTVRKRAGDERAAGHIKRIRDIAEDLLKRGIKHIPFTYENDAIITDICPEPKASDIFGEALIRGDFEQVKKIIDLEQDALLKSSDKAETPTILLCQCPSYSRGDDPGLILQNGYIDLTLYNAFWIEGELVFFDQEWAFDGLPLRFMLYYGVKIAYKITSSKNVIPFDAILEYIGVGRSEAKLWDELEDVLWQQVTLARGDEYGEDGYCNQYRERLTLKYQQKYLEREITAVKLEASYHGMDFRAEVQSTYDELAWIYGSRTWRYAQKLRRVIRRVLPSGALRTRFAKKCIRILYAPIRRARRKDREQAEKHIAQVSATISAINLFAPLKFEVYDDPMISVIIPVHNQFDYTYDCLKSIHETCLDLRIEVIVSDDASTDDTKDILQLVSGIRVIHNEKALQFVRNCNKAAAMAKGKYIAFLNNDTIVHANWLQSLLSLIESDDRIGLVGSKFLSADGLIQEAGGIVWKDGRAWNYGRNGDPESSEFNYVKEVDYISGCSILIRADLWQEIGGFDERYAPAYCEDSDLAFEVRKHGYKVVYQPLSIVTHFEGISNGTDLTKGIKSYQEKNRIKFYEKWKALLEKEHLGYESIIFRARERSITKKIAIFIDQYIPTYDMDAGSRTMYEYIKLYQKMGYKIILMPENFYRDEHYTPIYQQMGVEVLYGSHYQQKWDRWVVQNREEIDLVFMARPHVSIKFIDHFRAVTSARILYYGMDLHFLRVQRQYELTQDSALLESVEMWKGLETELIEKADCALFPSIVEENYIKSILPGARVKALPGYIVQNIEKKEYRFDQRDGLMFIGGYNHPPNADAVLWFANEIFPKILEQHPEMILHIAGSNAPEEITALADDHIIIHGFVSSDDLETLYASVRIVVVPLRYGAGIKGKVVEAMTYGVPVVTTPIGAEGFVGAERYLDVADEAIQFADDVCRLYYDEAALNRMVFAAYDYLEEAFSENRAMEVLAQAMEMK